MEMVWSPRSLQHLRDIYDHIAETNPAAALRVHAVIREKLEHLAEHPRMGRAGRVEGTRELVIVGLPYVVAYRVRRQTLEIMAGLHSAQKWPDAFD